MADQLYLSLWFPNFRLESLPATLTGVLRQFAAISGNPRVQAASVYPIDFTEAPTYQRLYVDDDRAAETPDTAAAAIDAAVAEATEQLHDDMAYEFEMKWNLWYPAGSAPEEALPATPDDEDDELPADEDSVDDLPSDLEDSFADIAPRKPIPFPHKAHPQDDESVPSPHWKKYPTAVRVLGFGPQFDQAGYAQNGHLRIDFGLDTPWTLETTSEAPEAARYTQHNVEMLLAFTLLVEKHCNLSSRLLWTESGEPLVEKLIGRLQKLN